MELAIEMTNINKSYPQVQANKNINLQVEVGEIHAIIGENGAGKTTLMNILFGLETADSGSIKIFGKDVNINSPKDAFKVGLGMVHQHFKLVPSLTISENIFLGCELKKGIFIDRDLQNKSVIELSKKFSLDVNPTDKIQDISVGIQQRVEILKALYKGAKIIILDEPTAVLTPQESKELFKTLKEFVVKNSMTVVFISHHLDEIMDISDSVTILRLGEVIARKKTKDITKEELASLIVGKQVIEAHNSNINNKKGDVVLEVNNLWARNTLGVPALRGVSFSVHKGEIVGIAGVAGNGQTELADILSGFEYPSYGDVILNGNSIVNKSSEYIRSLGMCHVPADRMNRGCNKNDPIWSNMLMGKQRKEPFAYKSILLNLKNIKNYAQELIKDYDVRASNGDVLIGNLSGGNIQKAIVAREFSQDVDFYLIDQPTRGVDISSSAFIHNEILKMRDMNKAILLISVQLDEIMRLSDRVLVLFNGSIVGEVIPNETTEEEIGLLMAGISSKGDATL